MELEMTSAHPPHAISDSRSLCGVAGFAKANGSTCSVSNGFSFHIQHIYLRTEVSDATVRPRFGCRDRHLRSGQRLPQGPGPAVYSSS